LIELELCVFKSFKIYQAKYGYRFSQEPFVLADSIDLVNGNIVDFGTGTGIIPILLSLRNANLNIYAVENNTEMLSVIKKNLQINNIKNVKIETDINNIKNNSMDCIVSNPPYFNKTNYRKSKKYFNEKFESYDFKENIKMFKKILKNKGLLCFSYHPTRLAEAILNLNKHNFGIKSIQPVYGNIHKSASFVIIKAKLNGKNYINMEKAIYLDKDLTVSAI